MTQPPSVPRPGHYTCFAVAAPGLAPFVQRELHDLGISTAAICLDGVLFDAEPATLYRANLWLRTASRILVRIGIFHAAAFYELERQAARIPWTRFVGQGAPVVVRVTCRKSRLYHSDAVAERVLRVITHATGARAAKKAEDDETTGMDVAAPTQLVVARLVRTGQPDL